MGTNNGRVRHWHRAEDDPKSEGTPYWRRSTVRDAFLLLRERGKGQPILLIIRKGWDRRQLACFQAGPAARNQEIFAGIDMDLGWRKRCPEVTSSRGRSLDLGNRLVVSLATAKRLPSARDSVLSTDARTSKLFMMGTCFSVLIRMELARHRDQIIPLWMYPSGADAGWEAIVNQKQHQPSRPGGRAAPI